MKICVQYPLNQEQMQTLKNAVPNAEWTEDASVANIILGNPPMANIENNMDLKLLQLWSAGCANYGSLYKRIPGLTVCCATGAYGHGVSEHMFACTMSLMKRVPNYVRNQDAHKWTDLGKAKTFSGANVLVLGLGDIGSSYARMARALGAKVTGIQRTPRSMPEVADAVYSMSELNRLLEEADVIAMALPDTPETRNLMNAERFFHVKRGAILVNAGRGSAIDEKALADALKDGILFGAALDVTCHEPMSPDDPLWDAPNLLITPHVAGGQHLESIPYAVLKIAVHNIHALETDKNFVSVVDGETGYRKLV